MGLCGLQPARSSPHRGGRLMATWDSRKYITRAEHHGNREQRQADYTSPTVWGTVWKTLLLLAIYLVVDWLAWTFEKAVG